MLSGINASSLTRRKEPASERALRNVLLTHHEGAMMTKCFWNVGHRLDAFGWCLRIDIDSTPCIIGCDHDTSEMRPALPAHEQATATRTTRHSRLRVANV
ncbi:hypothetical protein PAXRUDRAFT_625778 [Paxillus rubicundulus Ve08.2h10]|uniref:Uncharacterized protein n=1 Tax=Paxillus rubicundulus Ve08.2h10 TaxID=930991 RepID=A0A0D0DK65_9AGAM|nr:hypothetical protein PAXRUDRAFT_625778 [Paxillus rubicundulus Ve08.2h10]